jgi:hypothetical protein
MAPNNNTNGLLILCKFLSKREREKNRTIVSLMSCRLAVLLLFFFYSFFLSSLHAHKAIVPKKKEKKLCVNVYTQAHTLGFVLMVRVGACIEQREKKWHRRTLKDTINTSF